MRCTIASCGYPATVGIGSPGSTRMLCRRVSNLELVAQMQGVVQRLGSGGMPWLVKDPRLCLLLPQWRSLLRNPAHVVVVRDPREIAASMQNGPRGTFTSSYVIALWEKYLRSLLANIRDERALFVSYSRLITDPASACKRLLKGLHALGVDGLHAVDAKQLAAFLDPCLHRSLPPAHVQLNIAQQSLYTWLDAQCRARGPVAMTDFPEAAAPDVLLAEFEAAFDYREKLARERKLNEIAPHIHAIESELNTLTNERSRQEQELVALREQTDQVLSELDEQRKQITHVRRELDAQHEQTAQTQRDWTCNANEPHRHSATWTQSASRTTHD